MKRILLFLFCLGSFFASNAQYPATNLKQNFKQSVALGSKDSTAFNANDSLVATIDRNGKMMYRGNGVNAPFRVVLRTVDSLSGGYTSWDLTKKKIDSLGFIVSGGFVPYTGATTNVNLGTNRLTARSLRMDSVIANGSGGAVFATNSGNTSFSYGAGGSSEVTFNGFAGYNANRASSYTARSFTDKNYVDSADALRLLRSDSSIYYGNVVRTFGPQTIGGAKTFTDSFSATSQANYFGTNGTDGYLYLRGFNGSTARFLAQTGLSSVYNGLLISSNPENSNSLPRWDLDLGGNDQTVTLNGDGFELRRRPTSGGAFSSMFRVSNSGAVTATSFARVGGLSTQYQMADGSVSTLTNPVTGTGVNGRVSFWNGTNTIGSDGLFFWDNTNKKLALGTSTTSSGTRLIIQGTSASDGGQLGSELLTTGTSDASWTGSSFATGYTHVVGSVTTLTSSVAAVNLSSYQITYTVTGRTAGSFTISFGGYTSGNLSATGAVGPRATSTASLVITPTTDFDGTIVLSIREVTTSTPTTSFVNSAGTLVTNEIRAFTTSSNVGYGTGVLGRVTTGALNTGFGQNVMPRLTTGFGNTAGGATAMLALTIGLNNTGFGSDVLRNNISGSQNAAFGESAINAHTTPSGIAAFGRGVFSALTSGSNNVGVGTNSFLSLTSGSDLVSLGNNAGRFISGGVVSTTIANSSVFIGSGTGPLGDNQSNQIVIGHSVSGLGSNTIAIGNASHTLFSIRGRGLINGAVDDGVSGLRVNGSGLLSSGVTAQRGNFTSLRLNKDSVARTTANTQVLTIDTTSGNVNRLTIQSGNYTPTLTNEANILSFSLTRATFTRVGNIVTVYANINATTSESGTSQIAIALPFTSTTPNTILTGTAVDTNRLPVTLSGGGGASVSASWTASTGAATNIYITFQYTIN